MHHIQDSHEKVGLLDCWCTAICGGLYTTGCIFFSPKTLDVTPSPYATPGSIGGPAAASKSGDPNPQSASKNIWNTEEVSEKQQYEYDDPRPCPDYDIIFKQAVGTEDVFLGMGLKNPSTACCENMVVSYRCLLCWHFIVRVGQNQTSGVGH